MPSHYEPCGLNQLYSLKYGTVPIARSTGGLADTIVDVRSEPIDGGRVNGFLFKEYSADLLFATLVRAIDLFRKKDPWQRLMKNGMAQDWSWERSAKEYITLYHKITKERFIMLPPILKDKVDDILRGIMASLNAGLSVVDKDLNIIWANENLRRMLHTKQNVVGKRCYEVYGCACKDDSHCSSISGLPNGEKKCF